MVAVVSGHGLQLSTRHHLKWWCNAFTWHGLGLLDHLNIWVKDYNVHCFMSIHTYSWTWCSLMMAYSSRIVYHIIKPKLPKIGLRNILETSNKWYCHHVHLLWAQSSILVARSIHMQHPAPTNIKKLVDRFGTAEFNISSSHLWNQYHVAAFHHAGGGPILYWASIHTL